jgi:flagellar L-ring protein precursor FlgH
MRFWIVSAVWLVCFAPGAGWAGAEEALSIKGFRPLTQDRKALGVGDVLTISIQENASASSAVDLDTKRNSAANVGVDPLKGSSVRAGASLSNDSSGAGHLERSGRLLAQVTVMVTAVLPTGDFAVAGEQRLDLNREEQTIRLRGVVRPIDIDEHNVVPSNRVANAQIEFVGNGFLTDAGRPGLLSRILTYFGL